ncbi:hypothetical protein BJ980_003677 [Nocardioides daedukensis]|uniref:Uncharacterized protein n=1 Tax=Nocardioides daedukensis TaxID=634462 RepID=A0A7Y9S492_9ACTN|nr:hypothetical protein [Nocardioides daedukensis]NYG60754.1 hypothetical protein [Nocardioides daedukensis]
MDTRATPGLRLLRAAVLAFVALSTGAVAHVTAEGRLPSLPAMVMLLVGCTAVMAMFLARPATRTRTVALTVGGQVAVHMLLSLTAGHSGDAAVASTPSPVPTPIDPAASGSVMDAYNASRPQVEADFAVPHALTHLISDLTSGAHAPMMVLHLAAAVLVGLWLAGGERALWTLVALAATVLIPVLRLAALPLQSPPSVPTRAREQSAPRHLVTLAPCVVRRGPPVLLPA